MLALLDQAVAAEVQRGLDSELPGFRSNHFAAACALAGLAGPTPWAREPTPAQRPLAEILAYDEAYAGFAPRPLPRAHLRLMRLAPPDGGQTAARARGMAPCRSARSAIGSARNLVGEAPVNARNSAIRWAWS